MIATLSSLRPEWLDAAFAAWLAVASLVTFLIGLVAVPLVLARIPADYYSRPESATVIHPRSAFGWLGFVLRNAAGALLVAFGVLLLVLPGQGLLTIALGLTLLDFPGRKRLERRLVARPHVLATINALRRRARRPPLEIPEQH